MTEIERAFFWLTDAANAIRDWAYRRAYLDSTDLPRIALLVACTASTFLMMSPRLPRSTGRIANGVLAAASVASLIDPWRRVMLMNLGVWAVFWPVAFGFALLLPALSPLARRSRKARCIVSARVVIYVTAIALPASTLRPHPKAERQSTNLPLGGMFLATPRRLLPQDEHPYFRRVATHEVVGGSRRERRAPFERARAHPSLQRTRYARR